MQGGDNRGSSCSTSNGTAAFTLQGGAPEHALFVASDGDLGLGTNVPQTDLHMVSGDTPRLRLEQDGSEGFTAQAWEIGANEANFFVRDDSTNKLPFRIIPGAPQNSLYIDSAGEVGLGRSNPSARLDVHGDIMVSGTVDGRDLAADGSVLDSHVADVANPHQVTAAQVGAGASGTAAAVAAHEAAFHQGSQGPVAISEGGTGATDTATARANLGIEDDPTQVGIVLASAFSGSPATATVTFDTPYTVGTGYVVQLTAFSKDAAQMLTPNMLAKDETGFTISAGGALDDLLAVDWSVRPSPAVSAVAITAPADNISLAPSESFQVSYVLLGAAGVRVYLDGVALLDQLGSAPITLTAPVGAGTFALRLEAIDAAVVELGASDAITIQVAAPPAGGISCVLGASDVWNDGYVFNNVTVTNEGSETITSWAVTLQFAEPTTLTNSWNDLMALSADGTVLNASSLATNGTLAPGQSTTFGFQGTYDGSFDLPTCTGN